MVAASDSTTRSKAVGGNKVSKPVMEKKRRARINKSLDQLKTLLESFYANSIRKRKLEKADILELTVKHLRSLQSIQSAAKATADISDYQMGFRTCLANVNQYLHMADSLNGGDRWMLSELSKGLRACARGPGEAFSTTDSSPRPDGAQRLQPPAPAPAPAPAPMPAPPPGPMPAPAPAPAPRARTTEGTGPGTHLQVPPRHEGLASGGATTPSRNNGQKSPTEKFQPGGQCGNDISSEQRSVWRPW